MKRSKLVNLILWGIGWGLAYSPRILKNIWVIIIFIFFIVIPNVFIKRIWGNLRVFFPEINIFKRIILTYKSLFLALLISLDIVTIWIRGKDWVDKHINKIHNIELAEKAMSSPHKGVIFAAPHLGNWELLGPLMGQYKAMNLYKEIRNPYYMRASAKYRYSCNLDTMSVDKAVSFIKVIKKLKKGGCLAMMPDQRPQINYGRVNAKFYGVNIASASFLAKIIRLSKAHVLFIFTTRHVNGKYDIFIREPEKGVFSDDLNISTQAINKSIEKCIGKNIAQYNWLQSKTII